MKPNIFTNLTFSNHRCLMTFFIVNEFKSSSPLAESLALRHRVCLGLIELAERERGGIPYNWVVRSRPDIALPCALPVSVLRPAMVSYNRRCCGVDFIAIMPRAAADTVLREVPLARRHQISDCFSYRDGNDAGICNMALTRRANFSHGFLEGRVWNPN